MGLSVDAPDHSLGLIKRLGLGFALGSDPEQTVVKAFAVQNPDTQELALHAVYIVDPAGKVFYRKVARRRPGSEELLDAIDAWQGTYPVVEERNPRPPRSVAWPSNNFQTLLEITRAEEAPTSLDAERLRFVLQQLRTGATDESIIAFKALADDSRSASIEDLLQAAAWLTRQRFVAQRPEALAAGQDLARRLARVKELEAALDASTDVEAAADERDALLQTLGKARGGLSLARAVVINHQREWALDFAQGMLRSYREVARVMAK